MGLRLVEKPDLGILSDSASQDPGDAGCFWAHGWSKLDPNLPGQNQGLGPGPGPGAEKIII